jgi:hypothetical protein
MMMISRSLLIILISFNLNAEDYIFTVQGDDISFTDLNAEVESMQHLRSNVWKKLINKDELVDNLSQECWDEFILNKKINYKISKTLLVIEKINPQSVTYKYTYDLKNLKNLNVTKAEFINFCNKKDTEEPIKEDNELEGFTESFDFDDI